MRSISLHFFIVIYLTKVDDPSRSRLKCQFQEIGHRFISGIDYLGENLASFLGITSPKYLSASDIENVRKEMHQPQNVNKNDIAVDRDNNNYNYHLPREEA